MGDATWLCIEGKGCYQNSPDVEHFMQEKIASGRRNFIVDLAKCTGLDSTFMGMLLGMAKRLRLQQGCLHIIHVLGQNARLLKGLGVHYFCSVAEDDGGFDSAGADACQCGSPLDGGKVPEATAAVPHREIDKKEQTQHCLQAHEDLAAASEENEGRFREVIELMRRKAAQLQG